jgi:hypothetical protein
LKRTSVGDLVQHQDETLRLWLICLTLIPVLITVAWGDIYADAAYGQFATARAVARGAELWRNGHGDNRIPSASPLYIGLLALAYQGGLDLPSVGLILSMLGWILAVTAWFLVGLKMDSPHFAVAAGALLALHPLHPQVLGMETGFVLAALGGIVLAEIQERQLLSVGAILSAALLLGALHPLWLLLAVPVIGSAFSSHRGCRAQIGRAHV